MCRLQLWAAVIFISVISLASLIGMCAQLSLFFAFWGQAMAGRRDRRVDGLVAGTRASSGVERHKVLSGA